MSSSVFRKRNLVIWNKLKAKDKGVKLLSILTKNPTLYPPAGHRFFESRNIYREAFRTAFQFLRGNYIRGDVAEFGTNRGFTSRFIAKSIRKYYSDANFYLFDSFKGLPEISSAVDLNSYEVKEHSAWFKGQMIVPPATPIRIGKVLGRILGSQRIHIHEGYFEQTLRTELFDRPLALVHIDCDLYQSTNFVIDSLLEMERIQDGTVILFDDFNCGRGNPHLGERRALTDTLGAHKDYSVSEFFRYGWHGAAFIVHRSAAFSGSENV